MRLIGLMLARNEEWVIEFSLKAALQWVDHMVVLEHSSTDRTPEIIEKISAENPRRVSLFRETTTVWDEMVHRHRTLEEGRKLGGTHFAIIDADEVLTGNLVFSVREWIEKLEPAQLLEVPLIPCWRSLAKYRNDKSVWSRSSLTLAVRDAPEIGWKPSGDGYQHHNRAPYGTRWTVLNPFEDKKAGGVMHLQFANWRRLRAKHYWYRMMETIRWPGRRTPQELNKAYNEALDESEIFLSNCPSEWWDFYGELPKLVQLDGPTWYEGEIKALWEEHGPEVFHGLELPNDILGIAPPPPPDAAISRLWFCEDCGVVAVAVAPRRNAKVVTKIISTQHKAASPRCPGERLRLVSPENISQEQILGRLK